MTSFSVSYILLVATIQIFNFSYCILVASFHTSTARSLQLAATEDNGFGQAVTPYYPSPTTDYPSSTVYPTSQNVTAHSFKNYAIRYTTKTDKPFAKESIWPSSPLSKAKPGPKAKNTLNYFKKNYFPKNKAHNHKHKHTRPSGRYKSNRNFTLKSRRKKKFQPPRRRRKQLYKSSHQKGIQNKSKKRLPKSPSNTEVNRKKRKLFSPKTQRRQPYPRRQLSKPYPDHMRHSLLVLMPDGPRVPVLETIGSTFIQSLM